MRDQLYERMVEFVLAVLRREIFMCESIEDVERLSKIISGLEDPDVGDEDVLPAALDLLAEHYEF